VAGRSSEDGKCAMDMSKASELRDYAAKCRVLAKRARTLAQSIYDDADRTSLLRCCEELEARAVRLEKSAEADGHAHRVGS
jgi:hypothetical protein